MTETNQTSQANPEVDEDISHCYDPTNVQAPTQYRKVIGKIGGEDAKMKVKLIPDLLDPNYPKTKKLNPYWAITEHMHEVGVDKQGHPMLRPHPCQKMHGSKTCPECDKFYELKPLLKSVGEGTPEGKQLKARLERLKPTQKGWVSYITPDAEFIKCLKIGKMVINYLWGAQAWGTQAAIESLVENMVKSGINPYDLKNPMGWVLLWKTGEGYFDTKYHVEIAQRDVPKVVNGRTVGKETVFEEFAVELSKYPRSSIPDFREIEFRTRFTYEESQAFAANPMVTPPRILNVGKDQAEDEEDGSKDQTIAQAMANPSISGVMPDLNLPGEAVSSDINKVL